MRQSKHPLYVVLEGMKARCYNKNSPSYKHYGGRGISICAGWVDDRRSFVAWALENGYEKGLTIDRIDNDGNYEPSNCRFVTRAENCRNTTKTKLTPGIRTEIKNIKKANPGIKFQELADMYDTTPDTINRALDRMGERNSMLTVRVNKKEKEEIYGLLNYIRNKTGLNRSDILRKAIKGMRVMV